MSTERVPDSSENPDGGSSTTRSPSWLEMFRSGSLRRPSHSLPPSRSSSPPPPRGRDKSYLNSYPAAASAGLEPGSQARLALYIAMAHAGLAFSVLLLYGLFLLLNDFLRPIQWALLLSIPLRGAQRALVSFWSPPLHAGLLPTLLAFPSAVLSAAATSLADLRSAVSRSLRLRRHAASPSSSIGFAGVFRWLASFWMFTAAYERFGVVSLPFLLLGVFLVGPTASSVARRAGVVQFDKNSKPRSSFLTAGVLKNLEIVVAVGLILGLIFGFLAGGIFFSYKMGVEGKDAVMYLKSHVQKNNYAHRIGFTKWMEDNDVPGLVDRYSAKLYETVLDQVDGLAAQYNMTEFSNGFKHLVINRSADPLMLWATSGASDSLANPFTAKLHNLTLLAKNREWSGMYTEADSIFREFLLSREDLLEKAREVSMQAMEISKRVVSSSTAMLGGGASLMLAVFSAVISGAAEILNFLSQLTVFLCVLYYLITTESGGVTEQILGMLPISKAARARCVEVIDEAISSVFLVTAKIALFQGCLTWLLFRLFSVHFLYTSTVLGFLAPLLPLLPTWFSTIFATGQLLLEGRYVWAVGVSAAHQMLLDYGASAIQDEIPGHNSYLTGLSIIGGMALVPNALEGAIMGPLILTVIIALKKLYAEFVLVDSEENAP